MFFQINIHHLEINPRPISRITCLYFSFFLNGWKTYNVGPLWLRKFLKKFVNMIRLVSAFVLNVIILWLQLISEAIRHGDCHTPTMEMADRWITEKQVIHKLFKVLAPRYQNSPLSYTKLYRAPKLFTQDPYPKSILELRGKRFLSIFFPPFPGANAVTRTEKLLLKVIT